MTQALGRFGVIGGLSDHIHEVLALAEEYRTALCALYQERHERTIDLRNERFPALWNALVEFERAKAVCYEIEKTIKAHHSKIRNRNAVKVDQRGDLKQARAARGAALELVKAGRERWATTLAAWRIWFAGRADWKNVKALAKRRTLYAAMQFPTSAEVRSTLAAGFEAAKAKSKKPDEVKPLDASLVDMAALETFGRLDMECDLRERELSAEYQAKGLASGIRGEIDEASVPKLSKSGTGIRYVYGRPPDIHPWSKLTTQFVGGLSLEAAIEGTSQFRLEKADGKIIRVWQQIGTADHPRLITYLTKPCRAFPPGTRLQRWSLRVDGEPIVIRNKEGIVREKTRYRATAIPIIADNLDKPTGDGVLHCRLQWHRVEGGGMQVAEFFGPHVNERLILPAWLVDNRMESAITLAGSDTEANEFLAERGEKPKTGRPQGVVALRQYCFTHPDDGEARELLNGMVLEVYLARRQSRRAIRCIEDIYKVVVHRVCSRHGALAMKKIDFAKLKRYDTRDLLAQNAASEVTRAQLTAVSPGKLQALLLGYGLANDEVESKIWDAARMAATTDVFSSWVRSLGRRGAGKSDTHDASRKGESGRLVAHELR